MGVVTTSTARNEGVPAAQVYFPPEDLEELARQFKEILQSGRLTLGPHTATFESAFAKVHDRRLGVAVNSGTSALEIILRAMEIEGSEVIVPTNTFAATAFAVVHSGNRVVLAESNRELSLDPGDVRRRMSSRTKAIVAVHIGGRVVPEIEELREICKADGVPLIEDAAHAHGSRLRNFSAGTFGVASAFSFYPTKVMTSGEGGMILADDEGLVDRCRMLRDQGKVDFGQNLHKGMGYNWRLSEIHACIGVSQLRRLPEFIEARRRIAGIYDAGLADLDRLKVLRDRDGMHSNYYKYIALLEPGIDRAALKARMKSDFAVSLSGEVYERPLHQQPVFQNTPKVATGTFPTAEDVCSRHICLPVFASMTNSQAEHVVDALYEALA